MRIDLGTDRYPCQMSRRLGHRTSWRRAGWAIGIFVLLFMAASAVGSYAAVAGNRGPFATPARDIGPRHENVRFPSRIDRISLAGWLFHAGAGDSRRSVILVHGWGGNREDVDFVPIARRFLAEGFDVLMFDMRGSGQSGGSHQTLAAEEPRDVLGAYDFMRARGYDPAHMVILGNSMGAAAVIEAAPKLTGVAALICDSSFTTAGAAVENGLAQLTGLPGALSLPALAFAHLWGVNGAVSPIKVVRQLPSRAFLFIQSRGDNLIPPSSAEQLRAASKNPASKLLLINSRGHLNTFNAEPARFMRAVNAFITQQMAARHAHAASETPGPSTRA